MTAVAAHTLADRPDPSAVLQARFEHIRRGPMQGLPMLNDALSVRALGFRPWREHWLGTLVTPWFMNLVLMPRQAQAWHPLPERESRHFVFPAVVFEFIGARDAEIGDYLACSLFSPMFEFTDSAAAEATALAALEALFDTANCPLGEVPSAPADARAAATPAPRPATAVSKRDFLFGSTNRAERGP
jgi:[NiFe] hydrogenase assembly HybE family chaperone